MKRASRSLRDEDARGAGRPVDLADEADLPRLDSGTLQWILLGYLALFVAGFCALRMPGLREGNPLTSDRCAFLSINAITLTGLQLHVEASSFAGGVLRPLAMLGLTMGASFLALFATGIPVVRLLRLPYSTGAIARSAALFLGIATVLGGALLWIAGATRTEGQGGVDLIDSLLLAASACGNSGVYTGRLPSLTAWPVHLVLLPLGILGTFGLPVLMELRDRIIGRRDQLSRHARVVLWTTAALYLGGVGVLLVSNHHFGTLLTNGLTSGWTSTEGRTMRTGMIGASVDALNARSVGFSMYDLGVLPRPTQWVVILLAVIGGQTAGTAGGLKATTLFTLFGGARKTYAGKPNGAAFGFAVTWVVSFFLFAFAGYLILLHQVPQLAADQLLALALSASSNSGLSHGPLSIVSGPLYTLDVLMLLGRIAPVLLLWRMARTVERVDVAVM